MSRARRRALLALAAALLLAWSLVPWLWALSTSFRPAAEVASLHGILPREWTLDAWRAVLFERPFGRILWNGFVVACGSALLALAVGAPAAFALVHLRVRGRAAILVLLLSVSMLPAVATVGPVFLAVRALGLRDTYAALIPVHAAFALPLVVWFLTAFLREIPSELYHAARVDGCTPLRAFRTVLLPLAAPGVVTTGFLAFLLSWNEFPFALTLTTTERARTVPVEIALFAGLHEVPWREICAAAVLATLPPAALILFLQRRLLAGLLAGAVRG